MCPIIAIWGGTRNLENLLLFPRREPLTILSRICAPLNCDYPHAVHFRSVAYNRIQHCPANVVQLLCTNSVSFHQPDIKNIVCMLGSFLNMSPIITR